MVTRLWLFLAMAATLLAAAPANALEPPTPLAFRDFFIPSPRELKPSARLLSLAGKRVKLVGFMARMELLPRGAFYLTPHPVVCDEAGGGTADLPPDAVYVIVRSLAGQPVPFTPRALELTGSLEVGQRIEPDGRSTHIRLTLDRLEDLPPAAARRNRSTDARRSHRPEVPVHSTPEIQ